MNAVEYIRSLEAVGFSRAQAEVQAQGLSEIMETKFATKQDMQMEIQSVRLELKAEISNFRVWTESEFKLVRSEMREMENRLTLKLGSIMAGGIAFMSLLEHLYK